MDGFWSAVDSLAPFLAVVAIVVMIILIIRLSRRVSRGSEWAGPRQTDRPAPVGLRQTPWEVEAIHRQLRSRRDSPARRDLVSTVNRLSAAALQHGAIDEYIPKLPPDADNDRIASVIARLESHMELDER